MAAVKSLVVFMGVLILLGLGLFGYGMMQQSGKLGREDGGRPAFDRASLDEPEGTRISHMMSDGQGRLLLGLTGGGRPDRVVVIDPADGRRLGTVTVHGAAASR